jgi:hypothetical protein
MKNELCTSCKYRIAPGGWAACDGCIHDEGLKDRYEPMTNADRIRNMTDEELAKLLSTGTFICEGLKEDICENIPGCEECRLVWLKAPVEESKGEK